MKKICLSIAVLLLFSTVANASVTQDVNNQLVVFLNTLSTYIQSQATNIGSVMEKVSISLFKLLITLEIVWLAISLFISRTMTLDAIYTEFFRVILISAFYFSIILNAQDWLSALTKGLVSVYDSGLVMNTSPETMVIQILYDFSMRLCADVTGGGFLDRINPSNLIFLSICIVIVMLTTALITMMIIAVLAEAYLVLNIGSLLLAFGASRVTRDISINYLKYALGVGLKLLTFKIICVIFAGFLTDSSMPLAIPSSGVHLVYIINLTLCMVIIVGLFKTIPNLVAGLVNGSAAGSSTGGAIVGAGVAVASGGKSVVAKSTSSGVKRTADAARMK